MPPRTHIHIDDLIGYGPCPEFDRRAEAIEAWGGVEVTIEFMREQPNIEAALGYIATEQEIMWVYSHMLAEELPKLRRMMYLVLKRVPDSKKDPEVRRTITLMKKFLAGTATREEVKAQRRVIQAHLHDRQDQRGTDEYAVIDACRQMMNAKDPRKSLMRILRYLESRFTEATYFKFNTLAILLLKEEI